MHNQLQDRALSLSLSLSLCVEVHLVVINLESSKKKNTKDENDALSSAKTTWDSYPRTHVTSC